MNAEHGWVLYDGSCGICSRVVPRWAKTLESLGLGSAPLQEPWVQARLALPPDVLVQDIRLLFPDGRQVAGMDVYRYLARRLWWAFPFYLFSVTPGLSYLVDSGYRFFADRRFQFSRWCHVEPAPVDRHAASWVDEDAVVTVNESIAIRARSR